jgi:hypothetical protein
MTLPALLSALALVAGLLTAPADGQVLDRRPDCLRVAVALDVSGSMRPYFREAQEALLELLGSLRPCDRFHVIPFSETKLEGLARELTTESRASVLAEAETFVRGLRPGGRKGDAYGHYTNLDEGVDAAMLALLREDDGRKGMIVMISDGLSDPDPQHRPVDLAELGRRIPRGAFNLYLVDLLGRGIPGLEPGQIGSFDVGRVANTPVIVIPLRRVEDLRRLLHELESRDRAEEVPPRRDALPEAPQPGPEGEPDPEPRTLWRELAWVLPLLVAAAIAVTLVARRRRVAAPAPGPRRLVIRMNGEERRYGLPATLTIGGGERDDMRAHGAREGELHLRVSARGDGDFRLNGQRGGFFGARQFALSNGVAVEARVELVDSRERPVHRYVGAS